MLYVFFTFLRELYGPRVAGVSVENNVDRKCEPLRWFQVHNFWVILRVRRSGPPLIYGL